MQFNAKDRLLTNRIEKVMRDKDKKKESEKTSMKAESEATTQATSGVTNRHSDMPTSFHNKNGAPMRIMAGETEVLT